MEYLPRNGFEEIFVETISDAYNNQVGSILDERKLYTTQIRDLNKKIDRARELLLDDEIDATDFRAIKNGCTILKFQSLNLNEINTKNNEIINIKPIAERAIDNLK